MEYNKSEFLIEKYVPQDILIISRTELSGKITYANEAFCEISGYTYEELIGKPHNILRHPDMPKAVFAELWDTIKANKQWRTVLSKICEKTVAFIGLAQWFQACLKIMSWLNINQFVRQSHMRQS